VSPGVWGKTQLNQFPGPQFYYYPEENIAPNGPIENNNNDNGNWNENINSDNRNWDQNRIWYENNIPD
jgi:hypothetical protein